MTHRLARRGSGRAVEWTVALALTLVSQQAWSFPTWVGTCCGHARHDGNNPGTFSVLMNQDYLGLHAEVGIRVGTGAWTVHAMTYQGNVSGNALWQHTPSAPLPAGAAVAYYFRVWDDWGGQTWDSDHGKNYHFAVSGLPGVKWTGNTYHWPPSGKIEPNSDIWINTETWPGGAASKVQLVYTVNKGHTWLRVPMSAAGQRGNNDAWHLNLGKLPGGSVVRYAVEAVGQDSVSYWDNNWGKDHHAEVNMAATGDNDKDGLPNAWEKQQGLDPNDARDARQDLDGDGLSTLAEYKAGTDPRVADSDGDGLSDGLELLGLLRDPTTAEPPPASTFHGVPGSAGQGVTGTWKVNGSSLAAQEAWGSVRFALSAPQADVYDLEVSVGYVGVVRGRTHESELEVRLDGRPVQVLPVKRKAAAPAVASCTTPHIAAGAHVVELRWRNAYPHSRLLVKSLGLRRYVGPDQDGDGVTDWVGRWVAARNSVSMAGTDVPVSPAFVEGEAAFPASVDLRVGHRRAEVRRGAGRAWYADVPLSETAVTPVRIRFGGGARVVSRSLRWSETNLLQAPALRLRPGDALRLNARPRGASAGTAEIEVAGPDGVRTITTTVNKPVVHRFSTAGRHVLTAVYRGPAARAERRATVEVTVVAASLGESPLAWVGKGRTWSSPVAGPGVVLEADPEVHLKPLPATPAGGARYELWADRAREYVVVARVGPGGSVLASTVVRGFDTFRTSATTLRLVTRYSDGSRLYQTPLVVLPMYSDLSFRLMTLSGGLMFADGSHEKSLTSGAFDAAGRYMIELLLPASAVTSICHTLEAYQGSALVGK